MRHWRFDFIASRLDRLCADSLHSVIFEISLAIKRQRLQQLEK